MSVEVTPNFIIARQLSTYAVEQCHQLENNFTTKSFMTVSLVKEELESEIPNNK